MKELTERISRVLVKHNYSDYEIILADDGSSSGHRDFLKSVISTGSGQIKAVLLKENQGQQLATITGMACTEGTVIITMDDDLEHPPEDIPRLIEIVEKGADLVYGIIPISYTSPVRRAGAVLRNLIFRRAMGVPKGIRVSSFRALNRSLADAVLSGPCPWPYLSAMAFQHTPRVENLLLGPSARSQGRQRTLPLIRLLWHVFTAYTLFRRKQAEPLVLPEYSIITGDSV